MTIIYTKLAPLICVREIRDNYGPRHVASTRYVWS